MSQKTVNRRALITLATGACADMVLTSCGEQKGDTPAASSATPSSTGGNASPNVTESASPEAQAHPTFNKGYSGGSQAPKGEYRPADAEGPAQNVPKPKKPDDIGIETPEALFHFIQYWNDLRNYAIQTGDVDTLADYTSEGYESEANVINYINRIYQHGGWAVGGTRKLTFDPSTLVSPSDHVYLVIGNVLANDVVFLDNEKYETYTHHLSERSKDTIEFGIVFQTSGHWSFAGMEKISFE